MPDYPELPRHEPEKSTKELVRRILSPSDRGPQALQHRLLFYLLGALVVLLFLLALAQSINPPDSALRDPAMTVLLAPWDGTWTGQETVRGLDGVTIASYQSQRYYHSSSSTMQEVVITRADKSGKATSESHVNKVLGNGKLRSISSPDGGDQEVFEGDMKEGEVFWRREAPEATIVRRAQITGRILVTEEIVFPNTPDMKATITTGLYTRDK